MFMPRVLRRSEYAAFTDHLCALENDDRIHRFSADVPDASIYDYVRRIAHNDTVIGCYEACLGLVGAVHVALVGKGARRYAEMGVSVLPWARHQGIATSLVGRGILWARNRGATTFRSCCCADNHPMLAINEKHALVVESKIPAITAIRTLDPPIDPFLIDDSMAERMNIVEHGVELLSQAALETLVPEELREG